MFSVKLLLPAAALVLLSLPACDDERRRTAAREVSEEVAPVVEAIGPESAETPPPPPPPALTSASETVAAIEGAGGLTALGASAAVPVIDEWIGTLAGNLHVDDTDLLVEDLTRLKAALSRATVDAGEVGDILERLARETRQAGKDADDEAVVQLADYLEEAGETLD